MTPGILVKLKGREDSPPHLVGGYSGLLSALVNLICVMQMRNYGFACTPSDREQLVPALFCLRGMAVQECLESGMAHIVGMFLAVEF